MDEEDAMVIEMAAGVAMFVLWRERAAETKWGWLDGGKGNGRWREAGRPGLGLPGDPEEHHREALELRTSRAKGLIVQSGDNERVADHARKHQDLIELLILHKCTRY